MGQFNHVSLARDAFPIVSVVVCQLAGETIDPRLGELGGYLCSFAEEVLHFSDSQKRSIERDGRIQKVLRALENEISVRWPSLACTGRQEWHRTALTRSTQVDSGTKRE
jgi:hypothetical protein